MADQAPLTEPPLTPLLQSALETARKSLEASPRKRVEVSIETIGTRELIGKAEWTRTDGWRVGAHVAWNAQQAKDPRVTVKVTKAW